MTSEDANEGGQATRQSGAEFVRHVRRICFVQIVAPPLIFVAGLAVCFLLSLIERWWAVADIYFLFLIVVECLAFVARSVTWMLRYDAARKSFLLWLVCVYSLLVIFFLGIVTGH